VTVRRRHQLMCLGWSRNFTAISLASCFAGTARNGATIDRIELGKLYSRKNVQLVTN